MTEENTPAEPEPVEEVETTEETEAGETTPETEATEATPEATEEPPPPPSKRKWKIRGKEVELSDEEAQEYINRGDFFNEAQKDKEASRYVMNLLGSPAFIDAAIVQYQKALGCSYKEAAAEVHKVMVDRVGKELEYEHAPPEEKKRLETVEELNRLKAEKAQHEAREKAAREEAGWNTFTDSVVKEMEKNGYDLDDEAIDDFYSVWNRAIDLEEQIDAAEVARRVKKSIDRRSERNLAKLMKDPAKLAERAPALKQKIREDDIAQVKATQRSKRPPGPSAESAPRETPKKRPAAISMARMDQELSRY